MFIGLIELKCHFHLLASITEEVIKGGGGFLLHLLDAPLNFAHLFAVFQGEKHCHAVILAADFYHFPGGFCFCAFFRVALCIKQGR